MSSVLETSLDISGKLKMRYLFVSFSESVEQVLSVHMILKVFNRSVKLYYSPGTTWVLTGWLWTSPFSATNKMSYKRPASSCRTCAEICPAGTLSSRLLPAPSLGSMVRRYLSTSPCDGSHWTTAELEVVLTTWRLVGPEMTAYNKDVKENRIHSLHLDIQ